MTDESSTEAARHATEGTQDAAVYASDRDRGLAPGESGGLYRLLVESVHDYAIFALDPQGCILTWNAGAYGSEGRTTAVNIADKAAALSVGATK